MIHRIFGECDSGVRENCYKQPGPWLYTWITAPNWPTLIVRLAWEFDAPISDDEDDTIYELTPLPSDWRQVREELEQVVRDLWKQNYLERQMALDLYARDFIHRTGLPPSECMIVEWKGKSFIQWRGATEGFEKIA